MVFDDSLIYSTISGVVRVESAKKTNTKALRGKSGESRGFGPKSRNLLHPWNRDFLEGQIYLQNNMNQKYVGPEINKNNVKLGC